MRLEADSVCVAKCVLVQARDREVLLELAKGEWASASGWLETVKLGETCEDVCWSPLFKLPRTVGNDSGRVGSRSVAFPSRSRR